MSWDSQKIMSKLQQAIDQHNPELQWVKDNLLFMHVSGSRLYGMNREDSDYDIRGVTLAPKEYWVGAKKFEQFQAGYPEEGIDFVIYDFRKWLHLTQEVNPNVVETLYVTTDNPNVVFESVHWGFFRNAAKNLINQRAYVGYKGYATQQLKKMVVKHGNKTGRHDIVDEYGFDLKFAAHGFRLARQGYELLTTNNITFPRPDAEVLKSVRYGQIYKPNDLDQCVADLTREQELLDEALAKTVLPKKSDFDRYNNLLVLTYESYVQ